MSHNTGESNDEQIAWVLNVDRESEGSYLTIVRKEATRFLSHKCKVCGEDALFFIWSTSRVIDKDKIGLMEQFDSIMDLERIGVPICVACVKKYKLLEAKK